MYQLQTQEESVIFEELTSHHPEEGIANTHLLLSENALEDISNSELEKILSGVLSLFYFVPEIQFILSNLRTLNFSNQNSEFFYEYAKDDTKLDMWHDAKNSVIDFEIFSSDTLEGWSYNLSLKSGEIFCEYVTLKKLAPWNL